MNTSIRLSVLALLSCFAVQLSAATITIINNDRPGEGFNDPTPLAPVPGNPGTTLGEQRLNLVRYAASIWGRTLVSSVNIEAIATFDPFRCDSGGGTLGLSHSPEAFVNFSDNAFPDTAYPVALANALSGRDLNGSRPEIIMQFNATIDSGCLGPGSHWAYGTLTDSDAPTDIDLLPIVLHELAHGLGFDALISGATHSFPRGVPSIFGWHALNIGDVTRAHLALAEMPPTELLAAATDDPNLIWQGRYAYGLVPHFLDYPQQLSIYGPTVIAGTYAWGDAQFGPRVPTDGIRGIIVEALDSEEPGRSFYDGCSPLTNAAQIAGRIALITRGVCSFTAKALNAQRAGAIAVIIKNNTPDDGHVFSLGGEDPAVLIPTIGINRALGNHIATQGHVPGVTVPALIGYGEDAFGTNAGYLRFNAQPIFFGGSSVSHWTPDASPNLLMESSAGRFVFDQLDITPFLLNDLGWELTNWSLPPLRH